MRNLLTLAGVHTHIGAYHILHGVDLQVPEGAQTGKTLRLKGRGMPSLRSRERGDLVVEIFVETPTKLTARQKELMAEFAELCGEQQHPKSSTFIGKAKRFWEEVTGSC